MLVILQGNDTIFMLVMHFLARSFKAFRSCVCLLNVAVLMCCSLNCEMAKAALTSCSYTSEMANQQRWADSPWFSPDSAVGGGVGSPVKTCSYSPDDRHHLCPGSDTDTNRSETRELMGVLEGVFVCVCPLAVLMPTADSSIPASALLRVKRKRLRQK